MDRTEIESKVKEQISVLLSLPENQIKTTSLLMNDLGADSIDLVELAMWAEEEFAINVYDEEMEKVLTVNDFIDHIFNKK